MISVNETAEVIAKRRTVTAAAVLEQRADLRAYPHHYLHVSSGPAPGDGHGLLTATIAVDYLRHFGWRLVTIVHLDGTVYATVRRDLAPPHTEDQPHD